MKKLLSLVLVLSMLLSCSGFAVAEGAIVDELPRNETLYVAGQHWDEPKNFNIFALSNQAWPLSTQDRFLMYEALYMYNMVTGENEPLLADGQPEWVDDYSYIVRLKQNIHFSDGTPMTAEDVAFTYNIANEAEGGVYTTWSSVWNYLSKVEVVDEYTVRFTIVKEPYNKVSPISKMAFIRIVPKAWSEALFAQCGNDIEKVREQFVEEPVGSGLFKLYFYDSTRIVLIRDDNYWGQAENMFGKLTQIKYYCHPIFTNNNAGNLAFGEGQVDVTEQFVPGIGDLLATGDYMTYYDEAPYQLGFGSPSLLFNLEKEGLNDPVVHHAIARCLDYQAIGQNAMDGQTKDMVMCFLNPDVFGDYIDFEDEELQELMWDTTNVETNLAEANRMLDEAGYKDIDGDGYREMPDGSPIEWKCECPTGWSDWNAALEILVESAQKIGLNIVTYFPERSVYIVDYQVGTFDIIMVTPYGSPNSAQPYEAFYTALYSRDVPPYGEMAVHNYNRYTNEEVNDMIEELSAETDPEIQKELATAIIKQWLKDLPTVQLMYRPNLFHYLYTGVWGGFSGSDSNIPPLCVNNGAAIRDLYNIYPKNP